MASSLHPTASTSRSRKQQHVRTQTRPQPTKTAIIHTFLLQLCFLICATLLTLTTPTHAYPLLAFSEDSTDNTNTLVNEANASNTPSVGANATMEDTYGRLILDVGQKTVISTSNWVLGTILIIVGLVQVFYGFKFIRLTLILTGFMSWGKSMFFFIYLISKGEKDERLKGRRSILFESENVCVCSRVWDD